MSDLPHLKSLLLRVHLTRSWISSVPTDLPYPSPTSHFSPHSATAKVLSWQCRFRTPLLLGYTTYINNNFPVISYVELDLMPVNQFSIHLVHFNPLLGWLCTVYSARANKPDALERFTCVMVSLSPSEPNSILHSVKHCIRYGQSSNVPYYASCTWWSNLDSGSGGLPSSFPSASFIHSDKTSFFLTSEILILFQNCFKYQFKNVPWTAFWKFFNAFVRNMFPQSPSEWKAFQQHCSCVLSIPFPVLQLQSCRKHSPEASVTLHMETYLFSATP